MNASDLKGRAVVARGDSTELGHIDDVLFDGQLQRVLGFRVKRGILAEGEAVPRDAVATVDQDSVTITSPGAIVAEEFDSAHLTGLATRILLGDIFGLEKMIPWGVQVHSQLVGDYQEKALCIAQLSEFAELTETK